MRKATAPTMMAQSGFTLTELMIACAILALILAGTLITLQQGEDAYQYTSGRVEVQESGRAAVDRMVRDLRTGSSITAATQTSISFQYIDETGATVTVT